MDPTNAIGLASGDGTYDFSSTSSNENSSLSYEIFVRSFYDSNGDGVGDFSGVSAKADYLAELGIGQVWLTPIYPSPTYHGYDITDYYSVNSALGTMSDFSTMLTTLHSHHIKVYLDMVLNHSSSQHPYFIQAKQDFMNKNTAADSKADWYNFNLNNGVLGYEARFDNGMPDFNFDSSGVQAEFKKILGYWCAKGVDGFRLDAVKYYYYNDTNSNIAALNTIVEDVKTDYPSVSFVGENWSSGQEYLAYYGSKIDSFFCFDASVSSTGNASLVSATKGMTSGYTFAKSIETMETTIKSKNPNAYSSYFLSNHDQDRVAKNLNQLYAAKLGASITYLLPGTPYMYYGEEEQLRGVRGSEATDVMRRLPFIWSGSDTTGQCACPDPTYDSLYQKYNQISKGVAEQKSEAMSLWNHYKKVGQIRNKYPFIKNAIFKALNAQNDNIIVYSLTAGNQSIIVAHNNRNIGIECDVSAFASSLSDEIDTYGLKARLSNGKLGLGPYSSAILAA